MTATKTASYSHIDLPQYPLVHFIPIKDVAFLLHIDKSHLLTSAKKGDL